MSTYLRRYYDFLGAVYASRLISLVAEESLKDYPKGLSPQSRDTVVGFIQEVGAAMKLVAAPAKRGEHVPVENQSVSVASRGPIAVTTLQLFIAKILSTGALSPGDFDFRGRLLSQELVMLLAHLDAFFGDTLRMICLWNPSVLRRSKTVTWEDVLEGGSWEALMRRLVETYAYEFGWQSTRDKIRSLQREIGLDIGSSSDELDTVEAAEQARHIVVHNNCCVSHEYLRRTGRKDLKIGDPLPLAPDFIEQTADAVVEVGSDLLRSVAVKFLGADATTLPGVVRPPELDDTSKDYPA